MLPRKPLGSRFGWRGTAAPAAPAAVGAAFSGGGRGALWRGGSRVLVFGGFGILRKMKFRCLSRFFLLPPSLRCGNPVVR